MRVHHLQAAVAVERQGQAEALDEERLVIMTTGTQGEPTSALSRMAVGEHKQISNERGDVVVISARTIPGNERAVAHLIDNIYRRGGEVEHCHPREPDELWEVKLKKNSKHFIPHGVSPW